MPEKRRSSRTRALTKEGTQFRANEIKRKRRAKTQKTLKILTEQLDLFGLFGKKQIVKKTLKRKGAKRKGAKTLKYSTDYEMRSASPIRRKRRDIKLTERQKRRLRDAITRRKRYLDEAIRNRQIREGAKWIKPARF